MVNNEFTNSIRRLNLEFEKKINQIIFKNIKHNDSKNTHPSPTSLPSSYLNEKTIENPNSVNKFSSFFKRFFN
jgi:hypothetical protein